MSEPRNKITSIPSSDSSKASSVKSSTAKARPAKGIYVLPNLFTTAGLFAGFYAIMQARLGHFEAACLAIYVAMVMDTLDGRLARLTNTMSDFGSEYDSLADMVSFGVAPALLIYDFALSELGRFGSLAAFIYIACAALRLARFNVQKAVDKRFFIGVPSPGAAVLIASTVWVCSDYNIVATDYSYGFALITSILGLSMVSNIPYRSFKDVDFRDQMPFIGLIVLVLVIAIIYLDPPMAFLIIGTSYLVYATSLYVVKKVRRAREKNSQSAK